MLNIEIALFKAVAEEGSFSKAAIKLKSSYAAILKRINGFEMELGVRLFDRSNKEVLLTEPE